MNVTGLLARARQYAPGICRAFAVVVAAATGGAALYHALHGSENVLGLFEDDFFYYTVVADHLVHLHKLTFDGVTLTNGFHPLWFVVILGLRLITGGIGSPFFALLGVILCLLTIATYEALRVLAERLGLSSAVASAAALLQMTIVRGLMATGMEVALAIPLYAWLLAEVARERPLTPVRAAKLGFLASLVVLSRLDLLLAVALLVVAWVVWVRPWPARPLRSALSFAAGAWLVVGYFAANRLVFGAFLPTSARAKELGPGIHLGIRFARELLAMHGWKRLALIVAAGAALIALVLRPRAPRSSARVAAAVGVGFPVAFYLADAIKSDWLLFSWYAYPMVPAVVVASALLVEYGQAFFRDHRVQLGVAVALASGAVVVPLKGLVYFVDQGPRWSNADNTVAAMAVELSKEMRNRQGRFAMGDKAGISTFLLGKPVVQLEGLVADAEMLRHIERQDSLNTVLKDYGVDYLIVAVAATRVARHEGCYLVVAPNPDQNNAAPKMHGEFCQQPIAHFEIPHGPHSWSRCLPVEAFVFDVRSGQPNAAGLRRSGGG